MATGTKIKSQSSDGLNHDERRSAFVSTVGGSESDWDLFCNGFDILIFYHKIKSSSIVGGHFKTKSAIKSGDFVLK